MDERVGVGMNQVIRSIRSTDHHFSYSVTFNQQRFEGYFPVTIILEITNSNVYRDNLEKDTYPPYWRESSEYYKVTVETPWETYLRADFKTDVEANDCYRQFCEWCEEEEWERFYIELKSDIWGKLHG